MNETYLYPYSAKEARERNELSLWRESHRANIACRDAIEDTIRRSFDGMHLNEDCLAPVLTAYGYKRTAWVLSLIHISEPTRLGMISYAVFCLKKKKQTNKKKKKKISHPRS